MIQHLSLSRTYSIRKINGITVGKNVATYLSLLGGELFCRLHLFFEPIGHSRTDESGHGIRAQGPQFLEAPMVDEEWKVFDEIMEDSVQVL